RLGSNAITVLGSVALLLRWSPWAVLGLVVATVPSTVVEMVFARRTFALRNWRSPDRRRINYTEHVLANDSYVKEAKLLDLGPPLLERYQRLAADIRDEEVVITRGRAAWGYALSLLASGAFYGCYGALALGAAASRLTLGSLTLYIAAFRSGQQSFQ